MRKKASSLKFYFHTHWDREWYLPFETYRTQLVDVVRDVLDGLSSGRLPNFLLDGQSIILDDVVEIDPDLCRHIKTFMKKGKLGTGPWYVLADQMLVSGESLVRNLKIGLEITSRYGKPCLVGYCPDTFGHTQDLPRILKGFGIETAVVWRGVPPHEGGPAFLWRSPDGSEVVAYHLSRGYYQSFFHAASTAQDVAAQLERWIAMGGEQLVPVGADHLSPPFRFQEMLEEAKVVLAKNGTRIPSMKAVALEAFAKSLAQSNSESGQSTLIEGELRDNTASLFYERAYLLQGVLSTRLYLKRANRLNEHRITEVIEPLLTLLAICDRYPYPEKELEHAWKLLLQNQPHDSICGCSVDSVHQEMMTRTRRFNHVLDAVEKRAAVFLAGPVAGGKKSRSPVRFATGDNMIADPQSGFDILNVVNLSADVSKGPFRFKWAVEQGDDQPAFDESRVQIISTFDEPVIFTNPGGEPLEKRVRLYDAFLAVGQISPFSIKQVNWQELSGAPDSSETPCDDEPFVILKEKSIDNGLIELRLDPSGNLAALIDDGGGEVRVFRLKHRIRDVGDAGDSYNFDAIENDQPLTARFVSVEPGWKGPIVGSLVLTYEIDIPDCALEIVSADEMKEMASGAGAPSKAPVFVRSASIKKHTITTEVSLRKGVPIVFFDTRWDNLSADHRLEVLFDTEETISETISENHFSTVKRPVESGADEPVAPGCESALTRYPCQRFFIANGQVFLNCGLPEYGVEGSFVSLTVLRAVSRLSRPRLRSRGGGAGPSLKTPEANCLGANQASYGWSPLSSPEKRQLSGVAALNDDDIALAYRLSEAFQGTLWAVLGGRRLDPSLLKESLITLDNPLCRVVSLHADADRRFVILRLLNTSSTKETVRLGCALPLDWIRKVRLDEKAELGLFRASKKESGPSVFQIELDRNELATYSLPL